MTLNINTKVADKTNIVNQKEIESECKFIDSINYHKGHKIWEFNTETGKLEIAKFEESVIQYNPNKIKQHKTHKLIMKKNCFYVSALNIKNAFRKLNNHINN